MITITKERLLTIKQWRETYGPGSNVVLPAEEAEELARIALASLEAEPVAVNDDMAYAFHHALSDSSLGADEVEEIKAGLRAAFANVTIQPEPVVPDEIELAIENLKQKLVECNRYNYCADAVKGVEDACHAAMRQGSQPVSQTYNLPELIEGMEVSIDVSTCDADLGNRYFGTVTEALELDTAKNGYILLVQDAEPNFDVNGNSPVTTDGWISCSERMPEKNQNVLISVNFDSSLVEPLICSARYTGSTFRRGDATIKPGNGIEQATHWMPLPEPPQEVNRG
ncbi:TPA: DUF551 domain-containing protein [Escherichia coli]|nr:DUF551 domain-containing protein [Escherichia coli]EIY9336231.1 DUF551 domain-containing protein [Escherichia coli]ELB3394479.1 DUF551 domain-containing protein [Escherichia coli]HAW9030284.1 DUF551 domain-containing protein [Escherichia coli]HBB8005806.1 DUF551 domain-containing protein [Escherichia coli]